PGYDAVREGLGPDDHALTLDEDRCGHVAPGHGLDPDGREVSHVEQPVPLLEEVALGLVLTDYPAPGRRADGQAVGRLAGQDDHCDLAVVETPEPEPLPGDLLQ